MTQQYGPTATLRDMFTCSINRVRALDPPLVEIPTKVRSFNGSIAAWTGFIDGGLQHLSHCITEDYCHPDATWCAEHITHEALAEWAYNNNDQYNLTAQQIDAIIKNLYRYGFRRHKHGQHTMWFATEDGETRVLDMDTEYLVPFMKEQSDNYAKHLAGYLYSPVIFGMLCDVAGADTVVDENKTVELINERHHNIYVWLELLLDDVEKLFIDHGSEIIVGYHARYNPGCATA